MTPLIKISIIYFSTICIWTILCAKWNVEEDLELGVIGLITIGAIAGAIMTIL